MAAFTPETGLKLQNKDVLQGEAFVPDRIQATFDGLGLLLALTLGIWDQFELDVGV